MSQSILINSVVKLWYFQSQTLNNNHEYFSWFMSTSIFCNDTLIIWISTSGPHNTIELLHSNN